MAVRYLQGGNDDFPLPGLNTPIDDDSLGWWAGVNRCAAGIALASVLAITAFATDLQTTANQPQDELPPHVDEVYWQNPVPPAPASLKYQQP